MWSATSLPAGSVGRSSRASPAAAATNPSASTSRPSSKYSYARVAGVSPGPPGSGTARRGGRRCASAWSRVRSGDLHGYLSIAPCANQATISAARSSGHLRQIADRHVPVADGLGDFRCICRDLVRRIEHDTFRRLHKSRLRRLARADDGSADSARRSPWRIDACRRSSATRFRRDRDSYGGEQLTPARRAAPSCTLPLWRSTKN
mgnify:CR=1 FL=1